VVNFTPLPLYPRRNRSRHPPRFDGPQSQSGRYGEYKHLLPQPGMEPLCLDRSVRNSVTITTELSRTRNKCRIFFYSMSHVPRAFVQRSGVFFGGRKQMFKYVLVHQSTPYTPLRPRPLNIYTTSCRGPTLDTIIIINSTGQNQIFNCFNLC
jgi:hypothetical protein